MRIELPSFERVHNLRGLMQCEGLISRIRDVQRVGKTRVALKMESELPFGSYKMRGVRSAVDHHQNTRGRVQSMITISAGNMAQAVAACAKQLNINAIAMVPDTAPQIKTAAIESLGATLERKSMNEIWQMVEAPVFDEVNLMIHPLLTPGVLAGYGTIALEFIGQVPDCDAVFIPFGVGGLTLGVAAILKQIAPQIKIVCVETEAAPTLTLARQYGESIMVQKKATCADAIGTPRVVPFVLEVLNSLIDDTVVVSELALRDHLRYLYSAHGILVEGAAAAAFAAASQSKYKRPVAVMTGQNISSELLHEIVGVLPEFSGGSADH